MTFRRYVFLPVCIVIAAFAVTATAQEQRSRIVTTRESRPTTVTSTPTVKRTVLSSPTTRPTTNAQRPTLTNEVIVVGQQNQQQALVTKTSSSRAVVPAASSVKSAYGSGLVSRMLNSIETKYGIPYRLGTTGPNRYDCSGFVWSVFNEAGIYFERSSAREYWNRFEPVEGDDRFKFGTLVFFNRLGHVGIVADENGFYHASSSKGITYSKFAGYWSKRIVGFRRIPA